MRIYLDIILCITLSSVTFLDKNLKKKKNSELYTKNIEMYTMIVVKIEKLQPRSSEAAWSSLVVSQTSIVIIAYPERKVTCQVAEDEEQDL